MQLMMPGGRSEVPQNRFIILRKKREAIRLVLGPRSNVRRRDVAHVIHVEAKERTHLGLGEKILSARQPFAAQAVKVNAIFPVYRHRSVSWQSHKFSFAREGEDQR